MFLGCGLYHVSVHALAERVLGHIRREELLRAGDRVGVAVSGGIDSVALLRLLLELRDELGIVLSVVHFNHGLRGAESDADQEFVAGLAREHGLEFYVAGGDVARLAAQEALRCGGGCAGVAVWIFSVRSWDRMRSIEIEPDVPSGAKARTLQAASLTARLKPCPFTATSANLWTRSLPGTRSMIRLRLCSCG